MKRRLLRSAQTFGVLVLIHLIVKFTYTDRHSIGEVEAAIAQADIMGQPPDTVIARLRNVNLSWNDALEVSFYFHDDRTVSASASSPGNEHGMGWNVRAEIQFDERDLARSVTVRSSAVSPF